MSKTILRLKDVTKRTGLSPSSIYEKIRNKEFPEQIKLGNCASGWVESQIETYNSAETQRKAIKEWLRTNGPLTTFQSRDEMGIPSPAPRVYELRHDENLNIVTHWEDAYDATGGKHRIAKYVLLPGQWQGVKSQEAAK